MFAEQILLCFQLLADLEKLIEAEKCDRTGVFFYDRDAIVDVRFFPFRALL